MRTLLLSLIIVGSCHLVLAQKVRVVKSGDFKPENIAKSFVLLDQPDDIIQSKFVASLRVRLRNQKNALLIAYAFIQRAARKKKANAFAYNSLETAEDGRRYLTLDVYYQEQPVQHIDSSLFNKVFVFGDDRPNAHMHSVDVDGKKIEFPSGSYLELALNNGKKLILSKGGALGASAELSYGRDKEPIFVSVSGVGIGSAGYGGAVGVSFNTGRLERVTVTEGLLLLKCLRPQPL